MKKRSLVLMMVMVLCAVPIAFGQNSHRLNPRDLIREKSFVVIDDGELFAISKENHNLGGMETIVEFPADWKIVSVQRMGYFLDIPGPFNVLTDKSLVLLMERLNNMSWNASRMYAVTFLQMSSGEYITRTITLPDERIIWRQRKNKK